MFFSKLFKTVEKDITSEKAKLEVELEMAKRQFGLDFQRAKLDLQQQIADAEKTLEVLQAKIDVRSEAVYASLLNEKDRVIATLQQALFNLSQQSSSRNST